MKFLSSVAHGSEPSRSAQPGLSLSKENTLLTAAVALAFAFVTACLFMLG